MQNMQEEIKEGILDFFRKKQTQPQKSGPSYADVAQKTRQKLQQKTKKQDYQDVVRQLTDRKKELEKRQQLSGLNSSQKLKSENPQFYQNVLSRIAPFLGSKTVEDVENRLNNILNYMTTNQVFTNLYNEIGEELPEEMRTYSINYENERRGIVELAQNLLTTLRTGANNRNMREVLEDVVTRDVQAKLNSQYQISQNPYADENLEEQIKEGILDFFRKKQTQPQKSGPSYADVAQKTRQKLQQKTKKQDYQDVVRQLTDRKKELEKRQQLSGLNSSEKLKSENPQFYYNLMRQLAPIFGTSNPEQAEKNLTYGFENLVERFPDYVLGGESLGGQSMRVPGYGYKVDPDFGRISGTKNFMPPEQMEGVETAWAKRSYVDLAMEMIRASGKIGKDLTPGKVSKGVEKQENASLLFQVLQEVIRNDRVQKLEQAKRIQDIQTKKHVKTPGAFEKTGIEGEPEQEKPKTISGKKGGQGWQPPKPGNLQESKKIKLKYVKR